MRISPLVLLLFAMIGCGSGSDQEKTPAKAVDHQAPEVPEQSATPKAKSGGNLRLREDKSKRSPGKTVRDVFVVNRSKAVITVYRAPGLPHLHLAVQIKQPNGKVYRLIDAYPRRNIGLFKKYIVEGRTG